MSASSLTTIWCNGCGDWQHTGHNAAEARRAAKRAGWLVSQPALPERPTNPTAASLWMPGAREDYCPDCVRLRNSAPVAVSSERVDQ